ncbi:F-box/LRR-repeat protein At3g26922-like [Chenopodium quinoa]|uniref:F-box/LRR-repeat protein At3g26922-like n=1 Tax=Chenopodium quinoa TaxID=63459 RepID=UPI000B7760A3|nr:F-box/LRR-repeat protein At3g26922-like [Chenopodium quinoa]
MEEEAKDLISDLPDAVLHLIFSLIPTKFVITASSISKRWRQVSADHLEYASNLDFVEEFSKHQSPNQFADNLSRILCINKSEKIDKFKLLFSPRNEEHKSKAISWIRFATSRGVEEIDFDFCRHIYIHFLSSAHVNNKREVFELPDFLFDSKTLITVKLSRCILGLPEEYAGFGSLQTLCLKEVNVTDSMLESLLCNCKLLEVLVLKECGSLTSIRILSATRLKRLTVYECYNASVLEISGPNILSLLISAGHLDACRVEDMVNLEELFIGTRGDEFGGVFYLFMKILSDLAHVRSLSLYFGHLVPSLIKDFQVNFRNLQELQLVNSPLFGLFNSDVYCFFKHCSCPSLQYISIELSTLAEEEDFIWEFRKPYIKPVDCIFNNLRTVTLSNFRGTSSDIELAEYFLLRAPILESMFCITPQSMNARKTTVSKEEVSCSTSKKNVTKVIQKGICDMLYNNPYKASAVAEIRLCDSGERNSLLSFFNRHHVSDVYLK